MFKESQFNIYVEADEDRLIGLNTTTTATVVFTREVVDRFRQAVADDKLHEIPLLWQCQLLRLGFIVPAEMDEVAAMRVVSTHVRHNTHGLGLTICPTMACNLACTYCYQVTERRDQRMDSDTAEAVLRFAEQQIPESSVLNLHWYGGEPLMERDLVFDMTERMHDLARSANCDFRLGMVTNGTLLDQEVLDFLEPHNLESVQVTLDGPKAIHDSRKPMAGGESSFDLIVNNLSKLKPDHAQLTIRINVDDTNFEVIPELISFIKVNLPGCSVYPAPVVRGLATCSDAADHCIDSEAFAVLEYSLLQHIWEVGLGGQQRPFQARTYSCGAGSVRAYTIDPRGYLYKCWNHPGNPEHAVGHVALPLDLAKSSSWLNHNPYESKRCRQCKFLPLCHGGCSYQYLVNKKRVCDRRKHYLNELLTRRLQVAGKTGGGGTVR